MQAQQTDSATSFGTSPYDFHHVRRTQHQLFTSIAQLFHDHYEPLAFSIDDLLKGAKGKDHVNAKYCVRKTDTNGVVSILLCEAMTNIVLLMEEVRIPFGHLGRPLTTLWFAARGGAGEWAERGSGSPCGAGARKLRAQLHGANGPRVRMHASSQCCFRSCRPSATPSFSNVEFANHRLMTGGSLSVLRSAELHGSAFKEVTSSRAMSAKDIDWAAVEAELTAARDLPDGGEKNKVLAALCAKVRPFGPPTQGRMSLARLVSHTAKTVGDNKKLEDWLKGQEPLIPAAREKVARVRRAGEAPLSVVGEMTKALAGRQGPVRAHLGGYPALTFFVCSSPPTEPNCRS